MKKLFGLLALMPLVFTLPVPAASAVDVCVGNQCEVRFEYTGDMQQWKVPFGARNLTVELNGAQGGKAGGLGGKLVAALPEGFSGQLFIAVGGQGGVGSHAPGGFNGGGQAGGSHSDEGSGGGATDVRTSTALEDRILVAGGGGGTGGWSGAQGGNGGGLLGQDGSSGQGGGGRAGSQTSGGAPGSSNGGYVGSAGGLGIGGTGGVSSSAGGGGGGGGWFGGGGGGADVDSCCSDGGGGGGGSSYVLPTAQIVQNLQGSNSGNGFAVIKYTIELLVVSSLGKQTSASTMEFTVGFNQPASPTLADFEWPNQCKAQVELIDDRTAVLRVSECRLSAGELVFHGRASGLNLLGSAIEVSYPAIMDLKGPQVFWEEGPTHFNRDDLQFRLYVTDFAGLLDAEVIEVQGCDTKQLTLEPESYLLSLQGCRDGDVTATVNALSLADPFGNVGPETDETRYATVDTATPLPTLRASQPSYADGKFKLNVELENYDILPPIVFASWGSEQLNCEITWQEPVWSLENCDPGNLVLELLPNTFIDLAGNIGPTIPVSLELDLVAPDPIKMPEQLPTTTVPEEIPVANIPELTSSPETQPTLEANPDLESQSPTPVTDPVLPWIDFDLLDPEEPDLDAIEPIASEGSSNNQPQDSHDLTSAAPSDSGVLNGEFDPFTPGGAEPSLEPAESNPKQEASADGLSQVVLTSKELDVASGQNGWLGWLVAVLLIALVGLAGVAVFRLSGK